MNSFWFFGSVGAVFPLCACSSQGMLKSLCFPEAGCILCTYCKQSGQNSWCLYVSCLSLFLSSSLLFLCFFSSPHYQPVLCLSAFTLLYLTLTLYPTSGPLTCSPNTPGDGRARCGDMPPGVCGGQPGQLCLRARWEESKVGESEPEVSPPASWTHHVGTCCRGIFNLQSIQKNGGEADVCMSVCVCVSLSEGRSVSSWSTWKFLL